MYNEEEHKQSNEQMGTDCLLFGDCIVNNYQYKLTTARDHYCISTTFC